MRGMSDWSLLNQQPYCQHQCQPSGGTLAPSGRAHALSTSCLCWEAWCGRYAYSLYTEALNSAQNTSAMASIFQKDRKGKKKTVLVVVLVLFVFYIGPGQDVKQCVLDRNGRNTFNSLLRLSRLWPLLPVSQVSVQKHQSVGQSGLRAVSTPPD